ncbi:MAG TPA: 50S ribosomal protein L22 [archaeon]|nr:50S ribosomal protein L22 [archaeon]
MVKSEYTEGIEGKNVARGMLKNAQISTKYSTEVARAIRGQNVVKATAFLNRVIAQEEFVPLVRFHKKVPHRRGRSKSGVKSGRYPKNVAKAFKKLIANVMANADNKGLNSKKLQIVSCTASQGRKWPRIIKTPGRILRVNRSLTHVDMVTREA